MIKYHNFGGRLARRAGIIVDEDKFLEIAKERGVADIVYKIEDRWNRYSTRIIAKTGLVQGTVRRIIPGFQYNIREKDDLDKIRLERARVQKDTWERMLQEAEQLSRERVRTTIRGDTIKKAVEMFKKHEEILSNYESLVNH